jgi:hypothetical protein
MHTSKNKEEILREVYHCISIDPLEVEEAMRLVECPDTVIAAVEEGRLAVQNVPFFFSADEATRSLFCTLIETLKLSVQMQKEFLEWLTEIAVSDDPRVDFSSIQKTVAEILDHSTLNAPQKIIKLREYFHSLRYPVYHRMEHRWKRSVARHNPFPDRILFRHTPAFEKDSLSVTFRVSSGKEAKELLDGLGTISVEKWQELIYPRS